MNIKRIHLSIFASFFLLTGCVDLLSGEVEEPVRDNPSDLNGTSFQSPEITITENNVNEFGEVSISWEGGPSSISSQLEYRYSLLDFTSDWSSSTTEFRDLLANGSYSFEIEARYASVPNETVARTQLSQPIDVTTAPSNPHIVLYPHRVTASANEEIILYGMVLDGVDLFGVNMFLNYDSSVFEIVEIGFPDNNLFIRNQIESEMISDHNEVDEQVEFAQVALTNPAAGVDGFGRISMIRLRVRSEAVPGTYIVGVAGSSDLRNSSNQSIIQGVRGQQITVN